MKESTKEELFSWIKSLAVAFGIAILIRAFLFSPYLVEGASMEPTLHNHERIVVYKMHYSHSYERGDIVIIKGTNEEKYYVKRIIGLPGDDIEMVDDELYVNGKIVKEFYLSQNLRSAKLVGHKLTGDFGPIKVPKQKYFVMGDNRLHSMDSRNGLGFIDQKAIEGTTEFVFFPFTNIRNVD